MKTLFAPIHAPGAYVERSRANKHGLPDALRAYGDVAELDYLRIDADALDAAMRAEIDRFQPDLLFLQIQGATPITALMLSGWRRDYPALLVVNWNGDVYPEHMVSPEMLEILQHTDLQLVVNASVLPDYAAAGIKADYCPFGYEQPTEPYSGAFEPSEVVFLGNNYSAARHELYQVLRKLPHVVGVYGSGWLWSNGDSNYDFAQSEAIYQYATIAVSDNQFPDARGYLSDRPFQIMAAGGALLFQQRVADLEALTGLQAGVHYVEYVETSDLFALIPTWLDDAKADERRAMVERAQVFVLERHTWDVRVKQLVDVWLPEMGRVKA